MRAFWIALGAGFLAAMLSAETSSTRAQATRHGMHVHYTSLGASGGLEGRAFVPVAKSAVHLGAHGDPACRGFVTLESTGRLTRGPVRAVTLRVWTSSGGGKNTLSDKGCARAEIETTLEDGTVLRAGQGYIEVAAPGFADKQAIRGSFSQTVLRSGVPVTVDGSFLLEAVGP